MKSLIGLVLKHKDLIGFVLAVSGFWITIISVICTGSIKSIIFSVGIALVILGYALLLKMK